MAKKLVSLLLALTLAVVCGAALAETTTTGVAYGVYSNEGEHPDSLIRVTLTLDNGAITAAELDEKLIPVAMGGAAGWAELTDETAALLGLENTHCEAMRAEEAPSEYREGFDIAVSRAVARLNVLCELCLPFVRVGGSFVSMKAADCAEEVAEAAKAIETLGGAAPEIRTYTIPGTDVVRAAVIIKKTEPTPAKYPRRWARISKQPL